MAKRLLIIHGRSTKPVQSEKERLVKQALVAGLRRVDPGSADVIEADQISCLLAYYGDINNSIMVGINPELKEEMVEVDGNWYEPPGSFDADLRDLLDRPTERHTYDEYRELLRQVPDWKYGDDLARIASPLLNVLGLSQRAILRLFPDLGAYLTSRVIGSEIRQRLQEPLLEAMRSGDDVAIISHSMGCMVTYDVLWKLSRMSEYRDVRDAKISLWMTLGSPLGETAVQENLYDSNEPSDGRYPTNIKEWINISAQDDIVSADTTIRDDFKEMVSRGLVERVEEPACIYNFWKNAEGSNPHKFFGYLNHPTVAQYISQWLRQD
jgi:hypothetical protein